MQNKQLYSDWQQKSGSKNLVEFEKYWPLGCQRIKWEIKKKKTTKNPNSLAQNKTTTITKEIKNKIKKKIKEGT